LNILFTGVFCFFGGLIAFFPFSAHFLFWVFPLFVVCFPFFSALLIVGILSKTAIKKHSVYSNPKKRNSILADVSSE